MLYLRYFNSLKWLLQTISDKMSDNRWSDATYFLVKRSMTS